MAGRPTSRLGQTWPERDEFRRLAESATLVPVCRQILADLETPVSAYLKIHRGRYGFLLESVQGGERWGRYSFLGTEPACVLTVHDGRLRLLTPATGAVEERPARDPLGELRALLGSYRAAAVDGLPRFAGGAVGYLGYEVVRSIERLPAENPADLPVPDARLMLATSLLVFDNVAQTITAVVHVPVGAGVDPDGAYDDGVRRLDELLGRLGAPAVPPRRTAAEPPAAVCSNVAPERYQEAVRRAKEYIFAGDVIQVVLSQRFELPLRAAPVNVYRCLRTLNPSPYMFYLELDDFQAAGASPEVMARVEDGWVTVRPIAGTRPRGTSEVEDAALARELLADPKEIAEHVMLLDLGRNDVGRVAQTGTVEVTEQFVIERYSHVMHLVSNVRGRLAAPYDSFDAFRATFPAGTLTGAPKIRAMEIIEELEPVRRGFYGGAVGYFGFAGTMDTCITIRSVLMHGGRAYVQAGAGIVADSDPESEHRECVNKARAMLQAVRMAEGL
ncbi:MAG TPA: anthranilate synthase component I [Candidatus Limnocylindria bacterium]|nr:anthranilate synthase component I [Candidatus Limnocylindria bacterium]